MQKLFITKDNLQLLIKNLNNDCDEFIAPKREHLDDIIFGDTKNDSGELLDYAGNSVISPRAFLLPQTEELFKIKSAKKSNFVPIEDTRKRIFYGVRPCDIKALGLMKKFFLDEPRPYVQGRGEFVDVFYQQRLENSIFIALACTNRCSPNSFCHIMDAGPIAQNNFDLQLIPTFQNRPARSGADGVGRDSAPKGQEKVGSIPITRGYLVEIGSKKGNIIVRKYKKLFVKAAPSDEKEIKNGLKNFAGKVKKINFKKLAKIMQQDKIGQKVWDDIGLRCVICSGCITLCPTCSCFSIADRLSGDKGIRLRHCDGCPFAGFTKMAGGNTPFPMHKDHIRRFFEHKLNIDVQRYGRPSCVGCSRCIQTCPGNISIHKFIDSVERIAESV